jgi:hypothetical protein
MTKWVVYEYERVEVTSMTDQRPQYVAGEVGLARVVNATNEDNAILQMGCEGFFSAHPLVELPPRHVTLSLGNST